MYHQNMALFHCAKFKQFFRIVCVTFLSVRCEGEIAPTTSAANEPLVDTYTDNDSYNVTKHATVSDGNLVTEWQPIGTEDPVNTSAELTDEIDEVTIVNTSILDEEYTHEVSDSTVNEHSQTTTPLKTNLYLPNATGTSNHIDSTENTTEARKTKTLETTKNDAMSTDNKRLQSTSANANDKGKVVTNDEGYQYDTHETNIHVHTATGETFPEISKFTHQMNQDVYTTAENAQFEVSTPSQPNGSHFYERFNTTKAVDGNAQSTTDCNTLIVILSSVFVVVLLLISIGCLYGMWKIRRTWKRALEEEQRKTDIWSKETFNNTITNENYLDFKDIELQTQDGENLGQTESGLSVSTSRARRSYTANSGTQSSTVSGGSGLSFLGQHRKRASKVLPSKLFIGRSKSSYSDDALEVQEPESRGRASTFTHGKRRKVKHDTHNLVDHIETDDPQGILESVDNILKTQNKHIMTEL